MANVREGLLSPDYASALCEKSKYKYHNVDLSPLKDGLTYVSSADSIILETPPKKSTVPIRIKRKLRDSAMAEVVELNMRRSWLPVINFLQKEDSSGYGI